MMSCLGLQHVKTAAIEPAQHAPALPTAVQQNETQKVVWMQINNRDYTEITLDSTVVALLQKNLDRR